MRMISAGKSSFPNYWAAICHILSLYFCFHQSPSNTAFAVLYDDGQSHSVETSLNDAITLRSSSMLILPPGEYTIRSPSGSDSAIRLSMSSSLNATGGDVIGGDADGDHPAAVGVIVGSASRASFYDGVTVRGGNHVGADDYFIGSSILIDEVITANLDSNIKGQGGDALVSQYFGSNVTIHGGNFMAGRGSIKDGHSLRVSYEAQIHIYGGTFYGSWLARDKGSIVVNGCLSRIGTRLVGRLENGHSLDIELFEEGEGKIILNNPESCNHYRKSDSSAVRAMGSRHYSVFGMILLCLGFALV